MQTGSNGFALAPQTASGMLFFTSTHDFYFRPEIQMSSEEGLMFMEL
jgi:hypothetical protein